MTAADRTDSSGSYKDAMHKKRVSSQLGTGLSDPSSSSSSDHALHRRVTTEQQQNVSENGDVKDSSSSNGRQYSFEMESRDSRHCKKEHSSFQEDNNNDDGEIQKEPDGLMRMEPESQQEQLQSPAAAGHGSRGSDGDTWQTIAGVAGNVLEWYDFAVFGFFGDIIGDVFFPSQDGDKATVESFAVFGGAFLMRPVGGLLLGYIGDVYGRKRALVISIFLMAFPTFAMGCLPSYNQVGALAIVLLIIVRLLQGLSVGGQLMSSLVFTLENHDRRKWGLYGSFVMAAANIGTLLGGLVGFGLRSTLSEDQLISWGWRIPFLSGVVVSFSGFYLRSHGEEEHNNMMRGHQPVPTEQGEEDDDKGETDSAFDSTDNGDENQAADSAITTASPAENPLRQAFAKGNRRSLAASVMVPMLWSAGFYLSFVWMAIYMSELIASPVPGAFGVNSGALFLSVCLLFPIAGILSDRYGRRRVMTVGGIGMGVLSPLLVVLIGRGSTVLAFFSQSLMGISLSFWGAPMCAWLVESFEPSARLTSVAIGYNLAHATVGGLTPWLATVLVDNVGPEAPGWILTTLAVTSLTGLWFVAPPPPPTPQIPASLRRSASFAAVPTDNVEAECEMVETVNGSREDDDELI